MDEFVIFQNWPTTSHDKIIWETAIEQQRRARLEERAQCILVVRQVEGRDLSPLISWEISSRVQTPFS